MGQGAGRVLETNPQARGSAAGESGQALRGPRRAKPCQPQGLPTQAEWQGEGKRVQQFEPKLHGCPRLQNSGISALCLPGAKREKSAEQSWGGEPGHALWGMSLSWGARVWASVQSKPLPGTGTLPSHPNPNPRGAFFKVARQWLLPPGPPSTPLSDCGRCRLLGTPRRSQA